MTFAEVFDLPVSVDLRTAFKALGVSSTTGYKMIRTGRFPCPIIRVDGRNRVSTAGLIDVLGIEQVPVYAQDLEMGMRFATREDEEIS